MVATGKWVLYYWQGRKNNMVQGELFENKMKRCSRCGEVKSVDEFYKQKSHKDGLRSWCKDCIKKREKENYLKNKEEIRKKQKKYYQEKKEEILEQNAKYYQEKKEEILEQHKKYYQENKEKKLEQKKEYNQRPKVKKAKQIYNQLYYIEKKEEIKEYNQRPEIKNKTNKRQRERRNNDLQFKIRGNISNAINTKLKRRLSGKGGKGGKSIFDFLPYTIEELMVHLEKQFEPWMNRSNYGNKLGCWTIDHRICDWYFNYKSVDDVECQMSWSLPNLQPMEFIENIKKSNKLKYDDEMKRLWLRLYLDVFVKNLKNN